MVDLFSLQGNSETFSLHGSDVDVTHLLTAHQARVRGWAGAMVKSECSAIWTPSRSSRPRGHILSALSGPRPGHINTHYFEAGFCLSYLFQSIYQREHSGSRAVLIPDTRASSALTESVRMISIHQASPESLVFCEETRVLDGGSVTRPGRLLIQGTYL